MTHLPVPESTTNERIEKSVGLYLFLAVGNVVLLAERGLLSLVFVTVGLVLGILAVRAVSLRSACGLAALIGTLGALQLLPTVPDSRVASALSLSGLALAVAAYAATWKQLRLPPNTAYVILTLAVLTTGSALAFTGRY
jgi:hypothetical protein